FYEHFSKRFCCPDPSYVRLQMSFPNMLSMDQQRDIECEVSNAEIKKAVWDCASGLKINMKKSKIMGMHVKIDKVNTAATKLGCLILKVPFTYLGSKVGGVMSKFSACSEVVERVKNRLSKWKMNTLSIGGRLTLKREADWESQVSTLLIAGFCLSGYGDFIAKSLLYGPELSGRFMGLTEELI
nr:RNA-directed DNA polymerase, eukaryota, reverse transcriptase zinc-binding domain protein [Tanacetum cinerariifolium]